MTDLIISGGRVVTSNRVFDADVAVTDGTITGIGDATAFEPADRRVDVTDRFVLPGVVDPHVHINGPNSVETYETGTAAAAVGGVTTCITFAWQTRSDRPEVESIPESIRWQREAGTDSRIDFGLHAVITSEDVAGDEVDAAIDAGVPSFKLFTAYDFGVSAGGIERAFEAIGARDGVALVHTEDASVCEARTEDLQNTSDGGNPDRYPESRPIHAEAMAADDAIRLAREADCRYYGMHTSGEMSADAIANHADDSRVRAETCTHYLTLDESVYGELGSVAMMAPPVRRPRDADVLFDRLKRDELQVVSTDHVAFERASKEVEDWWDSEFGVNSLRWSLPVFHDEAVVNREFTYPDLVRLMCTNPARTFGLPQKGSLTPGTDADIVIFDPNATQTVDAEESASIADYSIYQDRAVRGRVDKTFVRGRLVAEGGDPTATTGHGEYIQRGLPT
ncbi:MAG: dihydropyrimidinase, partial [uncultured archaeon A07HB70]